MNQPCIFCFAPEGMQIRADKHGRPYAICEDCRARVFLRGPSSYRGLLFFGDYLRDHDTEALRRHVDGSGRKLVPLVPAASQHVPVPMPSPKVSE